MSGEREAEERKTETRLDARDVIAVIERAALRGWPAEEVRALGSWRLRAMRGVTHRGNSVWMDGAAAPADLPERIAAAEEFYRARGLPPRFQVTPLAPPALDAHLAERGYRIDAPTGVLIGEAAGVAALAAPAGVHAACADAPDEDWFDVSGRRGRFQGEAVAVYRGLLERLAGSAGFALARRGDAHGEVVAVGLGACFPPWTGISSMLTLPEHRGARLGAAVLGALARWSLARGAARLFLQVETGNAPALALYARAGFTPLYAYHYRASGAASGRSAGGP